MACQLAYRSSRWTIWLAVSLAAITVVGGFIAVLNASSLQKKDFVSKIPEQPYVHTHTYLYDDYPDKWPIPPLERVHMSVENTIHYAFNTPQGQAEWNTTLPSGGAVVHLGPTRRPFTVGIFHQIRCLGIIREILDDFYADTRPDAQVHRSHLARHCMNYLRQMVLCNADLRLETVRAAKGHALTVSEVTHTCLDWEAVYLAAEENYMTFTQESNIADSD